MNKDLVDDHYGRYFEIPQLLANRGFLVDLNAVSYGPQTWSTEQISDSFVLRSCSLRSPIRFLRHIQQRIRTFQPDVIIGSSDIPYAFIINWLSRYAKKPSIFDIYDNFDTYASATIPFITPAYYRSLKKIDHLVVFEKLLGEHLVSKGISPHFSVIPNTVDENIFQQADKFLCRDSLGLRRKRQYVAYVGAISTNRGFHTILNAWKRVLAAHPDAMLLLAGKRDASIALDHEGIKYFGELAHQRIPQLIGASDLGLISYKADNFGRFSFPVKAFEYLSCGRPVLAPHIGGIVNFFDDHPEYLYEPENDHDLGNKIVHLLQKKHHELPPITSRSDAAEKYASIIHKITRQ